MPTEETIREHIVQTVLRQVSTGEDKRREALNDFLRMSMPNIEDEAAERLSNMIPPLLPDLYEKWAHMFVDRLLETLPRPQIDELVDGTQKNDATLLLVFIMFLESERMEKQMAEDLSEYGRTHSADEDLGAAAGAYIRDRLAKLGGKFKRTQ